MRDREPIPFFMQIPINLFIKFKKNRVIFENLSLDFRGV